MDVGLPPLEAAFEGGAFCRALEGYGRVGRIDRPVGPILRRGGAGGGQEGQGGGGAERAESVVSHGRFPLFLGSVHAERLGGKPAPAQPRRPPSCG